MRVLFIIIILPYWFRILTTKMMLFKFSYLVKVDVTIHFKFTPLLFNELKKKKENLKETCFDDIKLYLKLKNLKNI